MEILLAEHAGFCFGVRRALEMAQQAIEEHGRVYSLGPLIHNAQVVESLRAQGLVVCESLEQVPPGAVAMVRAHGSGPQTAAQAAARGIRLVDATCPFVERVQRRAAEYAAEGRQVLVLGEPDHPEAQGIVAHSGGQAHIVPGPGDLASFRVGSRVAVVCQTTQTLDSLRALAAALLPQVAELTVANTICDATAKRQQASLQVAEQVDVMVVVGGRHSANTRRLAEICAAVGTPTYHVETAAELQPQWLQGARRVGVTAGASTPQEAIEQVTATLRRWAAREEPS